MAAIERFWFDTPANGTLLIDASLDNGKHELYETNNGGESWNIEQTTADPARAFKDKPRVCPPGECGPTPPRTAT